MWRLIHQNKCLFNSLIFGKSRFPPKSYIASTPESKIRGRERIIERKREGKLRGIKKRERERERVSLEQCDQIGRFLKVLGGKFTFKSYPNVWQLLGLI